MTIIETTVMLSVSFILAGALAPVITTAIGQARGARAANDLQLLATALTNFQKDTGAMHVHDRATGLPHVLVTAGQSPLSGEDQADGQTHAGGRLTWRQAWPGLGRAEDYFVANRYGFPVATNEGDRGWAGPYVSRPPEADPWGHVYVINTCWLGSGYEEEYGQEKRAVFALSAGPNGVIDTPFDQPATDARILGDDMGVRIQ